jgi:ankyrin repeat protein
MTTKIKTQQEELDERLVKLILDRGDSAYDEVRELLKSGSSPNAETLDGLPMFHFAAFKGFVRIVELLLQSGVALNLLDSNGQTALMHASHWPHVDVVKALLLHGADVNLRVIDFDYTPLMLAVAGSTCEVISTLIDYGADIKLTTTGYDGIHSAWSLARDRGDARIATLVAKCIRQSDAKSLLNWQIAMSPLELPICACCLCSLVRLM